ncbi:unnamed protein product [Pleuronectes platessa]|uniref:Uncharacterized protein n=1 Tax=Pleuronectes platessa TaxID=8262 RepID=A0A9N7TGJ1_PLEPL|nr:unnamed protein product [Pleuronectes platessa]
MKKPNTSMDAAADGPQVSHQQSPSSGEHLCHRDDFKLEPTGCVMTQGAGAGAVPSDLQSSPSFSQAAGPCRPITVWDLVLYVLLQERGHKDPLRLQGHRHVSVTSPPKALKTSGEIRAHRVLAADVLEMQETVQTGKYKRSARIIRIPAISAFMPGQFNQKRSPGAGGASNSRPVEVCANWTNIPADVNSI